MVFGQSGLTAEQKTSGFASPAQGYEEEGIDFNRLIVQNPAATFVYKLDSEELAGLGVPRGALLVIDFSEKPVYDWFVLLRHEGQFFCRLMEKRKGKTVFTNGTEKNVIEPAENDTEIIGKVTYILRNLGWEKEFK